MDPLLNLWDAVCDLFHIIWNSVAFNILIYISYIVIKAFESVSSDSVIISLFNELLCSVVSKYPYPWELLHWLENNCTIETVWYEQIAHMHGLLRGDYINTKQITKSRVHISSDTLDGLAQGCGDADVLELPQSYDRPSTWTVDIFQPR